jgi:cell division protein YceG involved in septum cleavage
MFPVAPQTDSGRDIDAYFFVSNDAGRTYYASSKSGHENNVAQVKKDNEAIKNGNYEG